MRLLKASFRKETSFVINGTQLSWATTVSPNKRTQVLQHISFVKSVTQ